MQVTVYTTPTCPYCQMVKEFLTRKGIPFVERNVAHDPQAAMEMIQRSGQEGVPVTVIDGEVVIGYDQPRLEYLISKHGPPIRLGASVADAERLTARGGGGITMGAYVGAVKPGSLAERVGLQKGDVIVELAGRPIRTAADIDSALKLVRPGVPATLTYLRGVQRQKVQFVA